MPRGGYRPGSGRKNGSKDKKKRQLSPESEEKKKLREMLAYDKQAKARFYQEFLIRVSKGEKLSLSEKKMMDKLGTELAAELDDEEAKQGQGDLEAYEYLRTVWNDPNADPSLRVRAAEIVLRVEGEKKGKKDVLEDKAKNAGSGKFAPGKAPVRLVK
jgi:hypothetical protein